MAVTFVQYPNEGAKPVITNWTPIIGYMVKSSDNNSSFFYQKLILRVKLDDASGEVVALMKQRGNGYSVDIGANNIRAFFDLRAIANAQTVDTYFDQNCTGAPFQSIHGVGASKGDNAGGDNLTDFIFSLNGNRQTGASQVVTLYVQATQEYSLSVSQAPSSTFTGAPADTKTYIQATLPLEQARFVTPAGIDTDFIQGNAFDPYKIDSTTSQFLSNIPSQKFNLGGASITGFRNIVHFDTSTDIGDYHTLAFLNGTTPFASSAQSIIVQYFESDGTSIASYAFANASTTGGQIPTVISANTQKLLYFGCGPGNLQGQTINTAARPSANTSWDYYTVRAYSTSTGSGGSFLSDTYYFEKSKTCTKYQRRRLGFLNNLGGYDYMNFDLKNVRTVEIKRENYDKMLGFFNGSKYRYDNTDRGVTTRKVSAKMSETLQTDYISEEMVPFIETLLLSKRVDSVKIEDDEYYQPVIIKDSSFVRKTSANNNLIQYTIKIEYANYINTNT
tara:strand:+ start:1238 stop:2749 length:1512 start_codon:yes stop_codon:yes gene_type:complete